MKKFFTIFMLLFLAVAYGAMTGADLFCGTAYAASKPKPGNGGPDDPDDGSGDDGGNGGPDDTNDDGGCGGGGSGDGGGADPDGSGGYDGV